MWTVQPLRLPHRLEAECGVDAGQCGVLGVNSEDDVRMSVFPNPPRSTAIGVSFKTGGGQSYISPEFVSLLGQVGERVGEIDNGRDRGLRQRTPGKPKFDSAVSKRLCARPR